MKTTRPLTKRNATVEAKTFALDDACLTKNIIYEATVTTSSGNARTYIGVTEHEFKTRYNNHKLSFKDRKHSHDTELSKHI